MSSAEFYWETTAQQVEHSTSTSSRRDVTFNKELSPLDQTSFILGDNMTNVWQTLEEKPHISAPNLNVQTRLMITLWSETHCRERIDYINPEVFTFHCCCKSVNRPLHSCLRGAQSQTNKHKLTLREVCLRRKSIMLNMLYL